MNLEELIQAQNGNILRTKPLRSIMAQLINFLAFSKKIGLNLCKIQLRSFTLLEEGE